MTADHFIPYKEVILRCIDNCTNQAHLECCYDLVSRFPEVFNEKVDGDTLAAALQEMEANYLQKSHELHIY
jgi:hypothetical protein